MVASLLKGTKPREGFSRGLEDKTIAKTQDLVYT
jgi:hypothetical protein